ncbi:phage tail tape measure protein [Virgibacillus halodenitrificans]|nr:phage tail tape measure protein [Virgibacillus halodenitrificans]
MADKERNVVLNFKMDGQVQYAETIKDINRVMNVAAKEYKNHVAAMGKDASATEKLAAEKKKLEIQMQGAQKRTQMLRDEYEAMAKDTNTSSAELEKMYGKLLDSERAEMALQKSLDRVNEGLSDQAQEAREAMAQLDDLKGESKLLEQEQKNLTGAFKLQTAELGDNASEAEKTELAQKQLTQQMELTERAVDNLEKQLEATKKIYGENSVEVLQMEGKLNDARLTVQKFSNSLDDIEESGKDAGEGLEELGKKMDLNNLLEATELLQGVTDKLLEVGQAAFDSGMAFADSQTNLQANLGLTADEAEKLNDVVNDVFKNGVVDSMEEATEAVILTKRTFKDLNDVELETITNKITTIAKRTGTDVQENIRGAEQLMIAFGLKGDEALDLIASGYQNGLNRSDDFMDTLIEYSPLFEQAGFDAEQMMNIINNGLESGAFNADKAADAVKEFGVFINDGKIADNIELYSKGTQELFDKYKDGKATAADVFASISQDIVDTNDKQKKYEMGVSAFGTMYEDLGDKAVESFAETGGAIDKVNGKADEMAEKAPGEKWQSSLRELYDTFLPLGIQLTEIAQDILPPVVDGLTKLFDWFTKLPGPLQTFITVFGSLLLVAGIAAPVILGVAAAILTLEIALLPIIAIVVAVAAAIAGIVLVIQNWGAITDWIGEKWDLFTAWLSESVSTLATNFVNWFNDMKTGAVNKFNELKDKGIAKVNDLKTRGINTLKGFKDGAINKANELKNGFVNKAQDLKQGAINKYNELKNGAINTISGLKNGAINKANEMKTSFVNKVKSLKDGAINRFNDLRDRASSVMEQTRKKIVAPIEKARDLIKTAIEKIKGFFSGLGDKLKIKIPRPKLPRFTISGGFDLTPPSISVPKIGIKWNARGGIFTQPTIFGASGGQLQGAGEAGPEAVLPLNEKTLGDIGKGIAESMGATGDIAVHVYMDMDEMTTKMAPGMSKQLNSNNKMKARQVGVIVT